MTKLSEEQLNNLSKEELVAQAMELQDQYINLSQRVDYLTEQIMLMNQRQFGRKTEKNISSVPDGQMNLFQFFNEVEALAKPSLPEPSINSIPVKSHSRKQRGKREEDLKDLPIRIIEHTLSDEELKETFPNGYKELPDESKPIVLYDYQKTRKLDHPREFLKDIKGIVITDGYQVYHSIEKLRQDITVAGCWVHAKRKFSEINKAFGHGSKREAISHEAVDRISMMFMLDKELNDLSKSERESKRQSVLKPLVDDFFVWTKDVYSKTANKSALGEALRYCINQEQYLRVFLTNGDVPMDNNAAERAIRPFTIGRKNWVMIDTIKGAEASAIIYSIVETAKANNLRTYDYLELLLTEIPNHMDDKNFDYFEKLMPWSDYVQEKCHSLKKS